MKYELWRSFDEGCIVETFIPIDHPQKDRLLEEGSVLLWTCEAPTFEAALKIRDERRTADRASD